MLQRHPVRTSSPQPSRYHHHHQQSDLDAKGQERTPSMFLDAPFDVSASYPSSSSSLSATNVSGLFGQSNPLKATASRTPVHKRMSSSSSPDGNNHGDGGGGSEGYASRQSHHRRQCLCGNVLVNDELEGEEEDGMYCSVACARADALSSLCFHEQPILHATTSSSSSSGSLNTLTASSSSGTIVSNRTSAYYGGGGFGSYLAARGSMSHEPVPTGALMLSSIPASMSSSSTLSSTRSTLEPHFTSSSASDPAELNMHGSGISPRPQNASSLELTNVASDHSTASHYRRMTREEMRREERKLGRRRRRDQRGSVVIPGVEALDVREYGGGAREQPHQVDDWQPLAVGQEDDALPELVGGRAYHHTRNSSTATSSSVATSMTSCTLETRIDSFALSRSASTSSSASGRSSTVSSRSHRGLKPAFPGIDERDEDGDDEMGLGRGGGRSRASPFVAAATDEHHHQDMKAMLDEIIRMESDFVLYSSASEAEENSRAATLNRSRRHHPHQPAATIPRTPPLGVAASRRLSLVVPPAPLRGSDRRYSMSSTPPMQLHHAELAIAAQLHRHSRGGRHAPSKSLSHLEHDAHLARSPMSTDRVPSRRSISPIRRSLTFAPLENRFDTPPHLIRRPTNPVQPTPPQSKVPTAALTRFRFPSGGNNGMDTPQPSQHLPLPLLIDTKLGVELSSSSNELRTPTQSTMPILALDGSSSMMDAQTDTPLGPSLFPPSPAPTYAPDSGFRLGMLLGSNDDL